MWGNQYFAFDQILVSPMIWRMQSHSSRYSIIKHIADVSSSLLRKTLALKALTPADSPPRCSSHPQSFPLFTCLQSRVTDSQTAVPIPFSTPLFLLLSFVFFGIALRETCELLVTAATRSNTSHDLSQVCMVGGLPARAATSSNTLNSLTLFRSQAGFCTLRFDLC